MQSWYQICNLRTTLLHLQFLYASLKEKTQQQEQAVERAHRDRVMQYYYLWKDYLEIEDSNFKRLIIIKLESCLALYGSDEQLWEVLEEFKKYANVVELQMLENMSKIYIGKNVMFDIEEVEKGLVEIQAKIYSFMSKYQSVLQQYNNCVLSWEQTKQVFDKYLSQIKAVYKQMEGGYGRYLMRKLQARSKQIDCSLKELKMALIR